MYIVGVFHDFIVLVWHRFTLILQGYYIEILIPLFGRDEIISERCLKVISPKCRIYASVNLATTGSDNWLSHVRRQVITWTSTDFFLNWTLWIKLQWNLIQNTRLFNHENAFENVVCEMLAILFRGISVKWTNTMKYTHAWFCSVVCLITW